MYEKTAICYQLQATVFFELYIRWKYGSRHYRTSLNYFTSYLPVLSFCLGQTSAVLDASSSSAASVEVPQNFLR